MAFTLPELPYAFDALEPSIDAATMQVHYKGHHGAYVTNLNAAVAGKPQLESKSPEALISDLSAVPEDVRGAVRNNGGGHVNHSLFWPLMAAKSAGGGGEPTGQLGEAIKSTFGSFADFKTKFMELGTKRFGSGWVWLAVKDGKLVLGSVANQDNPLMGESVAGMSGKPVLGLDVWEHAYYLRYQNKRADYMKAWWDVVNWKRAEELYNAARK